MKRTTVYLPEELKAALERRASAEGCSEAELIREALREKLEEGSAPRPRVPLTGKPLGDPTYADRVDELLARFGSE